MFMRLFFLLYFYLKYMNLTGKQIEFILTEFFGANVQNLFSKILMIEEKLDDSTLVYQLKRFADKCRNPFSHELFWDPFDKVNMRLYSHLYEESMSKLKQIVDKKII